MVPPTDHPDEEYERLVAGFQRIREEQQALAARVGESGAIDAPQDDLDHPDRSLECEETLKPGLSALADEAVAAGWMPNEVDLALLTLALARLKSADVNLDVDKAIARASRLIG